MSTVPGGRPASPTGHCACGDQRNAIAAAGQALLAVPGVQVSHVTSHAADHAAAHPLLAPYLTRSEWTPHAGLKAWVTKQAELTKPDRVHLCDGSDAENEALLNAMVREG